MSRARPTSEPGRLRYAFKADCRSAPPGHLRAGTAVSPLEVDGDGGVIAWTPGADRRIALVEVDGGHNPLGECGRTQYEVDPQTTVPLRS